MKLQADFTLNQSENGFPSIQGEGPQYSDLDLFGGKIQLSEIMTGAGRVLVSLQAMSDFSAVIGRIWSRVA